MGHGMGNQRVVVYVLLLVGHHATIGRTLGTLAPEGEHQAVACHAIVERDDMVVYAAIGLLLHVHVAHAHIPIMGLLQTV